jgi:hypothetical protein
MDGGGVPRTIPLRWLRSFRVIRRAERRNHRRFERQLTRAGRALRDGSSIWLHDVWDARVNAFIGTELFYVSRMSLLHSTGSFVLTRSGPEVTLRGTVQQHWLDPYDWNRGRWVYIPRHGWVPIAVGRELADADEARVFLMESRYVQTLDGTLRDSRQNGWRQHRDKASFAWSLVSSSRLPR